MINAPLTRSESGPLQPEVKPNNMSTAKITIFEKAGVPLTLKEVEIPALKTGEVLVRTECTTLCRSDLATYVGRRIEKTPTILGHEIVGRIAAFGALYDCVAGFFCPAFADGLRRCAGCGFVRGEQFVTQAADGAT